MGLQTDRYYGMPQPLHHVQGRLVASDTGQALHTALVVPIRCLPLACFLPVHS